jgi:hypothetical protein
MGGESRYPVKIPSNQIKKTIAKQRSKKNIKYYSSNSYSAGFVGLWPTRANQV